MKNRILRNQGKITPKRSHFCILGIITGAAFISLLYMATITSELQRFVKPNYLTVYSNDTTISVQSKIIEINETQGIQVHFHEKPAWVSPKVFETCEYKCYMSTTPNGFHTAHAEVFHGPKLGSSPPRKIPGRIWILYGMESPVHYENNLQKWANLFNWTMAYRRDADISEMYGHFTQLTDQKNRQLSRPIIWDTKDRMTAWFVSNCGGHSKREEYTKLLNKSINVHVYGRCGSFKCPHGVERYCKMLLRKHYKFYLSFENSFCLDYITEKAFKIFSSSLNTIPVMRGQGNYSMYFPPGSYLDTKDFRKPEDLAKQMTVIAANKSNFVKYFMWKNKTSVSRRSQWCELCKRLHFPGKYKRLYFDIQSFLEDKPRTACRSPTDLE